MAMAGCGGEKVSGPPPAAPERIRLESPAFRDGGTLPERFTCDGAKVSPPLAWSGVPRRARGLVLLAEDPDAPGGTFLHWSLFELVPSLRRLREGEVPTGAAEGENSFGDTGYGAPCPPEGDDPHRYVFTLYALSVPLVLEGGATPSDVRTAISRAALARGTLSARYGR